MNEQTEELLDKLRHNDDLPAALQEAVKSAAWLWELARHGDPEALPRLSDWFDAAELDPAELPDRFTIEAFAHAVDALGGELTAEQRMLVTLAHVRSQPDEADAAPLTQAESSLQYDAETAPAPQEWLAAGEEERVHAIRRFHTERRPHPEPDNLDLHVMSHSIVENQLAEDFPAIREACKRLQDQGLSRHDAIHALGQQALVVIAPIIESDAQPDPHALIDAYEEASAESYLATVQHLGSQPREAGAAPTYDASTAPDQTQWLAASEPERVTAIIEHHKGDAPHPEPEDISRHAMVHAIVENHIAQDFPGIREACERLQQEGLGRHDAIHTLGERALALIKPVLESDAQLDPTALSKAYQEATVDEHGETRA